MRTAVEDGDAEMVGMLIDAKANVDKRSGNVSVCMRGIFFLLYMCFACDIYCN